MISLPVDATKRAPKCHPVQSLTRWFVGGGIWGRDEPLEESRHVEFVSASSPPLLVQRHVERIDQIL
jgi:hypothetical protein